MSVFGGIGQPRRDGPFSQTGSSGPREEVRRPARSTQLATGTLACARCDAPVAVGPVPRTLTDELTCPFCDHRGPVRDFLSLAPPTRPARVVVRIALPRRP
ncbi:MAG TPA: hypothetical protein VHX62_05720 [Solirubrobacteraceae bacterium]|jgi:hypothetical protein|nr:hypothetical protein [Solirubrobacteraceae bacterium]